MCHSRADTPWIITLAGYGEEMCNMLKVSGTLRFVTNAYSSYYISIAIKTFNKNILYFEKFGTLVINISNANALPIVLLVRSFYLSIFFLYIL